jgi:hypothetical protein
MAIYPTQSNYIIDVDIITTTSFKAGMVLMRDDNGRAIPADNSTLLYKTIQQKAGKHLGFAASDHDISGVTIVEPDVISTNWLDNNKNFQRYENAETTHIRRYIQEHSDPTFDISNPSNRSIIGKRGIGVYNQSGELYITDQFKPVLHGDFGQDYTDIQTVNPGDLLTIGSGINAGKMVKVNVNSIGTDIIVVGVTDRYDTNSGLLYFTNAFYSVTFSSSSAVMALDAGNSLSFPNTGSIGTVCGFAGESGSFTLTAPAGHVFDKVLFASYGNPDGICGSFTLGSCNSATSQSVVEGLLLGNNSATLTASNTPFGDPCGGVSKRLYVQARFAPTQAKDLTINNNNGTLTNGVTYDTSGGGSWSFDGTNDFISLGIRPTIDGYQLPITLSGWFYLNSTSGFKTISGIYSGGSVYNLLRIDGSTFRFFLSKDVGDFQFFDYSTPLIINTWYNFAVVVGGALTSPTLTMYINNVPQTFSPVNLKSSVILNQDYRIGGHQNNYEFFNGLISQFRIYNRVLSASEISAYYNASKSRYGL